MQASSRTSPVLIRSPRLRARPGDHHRGDWRVRRPRLETGGSGHSSSPRQLCRHRRHRRGRARAGPDGRAGRRRHNASRPWIEGMQCSDGGLRRLRCRQTAQGSAGSCRSRFRRAHRPAKRGRDGHVAEMLAAWPHGTSPRSRPITRWLLRAAGEDDRGFGRWGPTTSTNGSRIPALVAAGLGTEHRPFVGVRGWSVTKPRRRGERTFATLPGDSYRGRDVHSVVRRPGSCLALLPRASARAQWNRAWTGWSHRRRRKDMGPNRGHRQVSRATSTSTTTSTGTVPSHGTELREGRRPRVSDAPDIPAARHWPWRREIALPPN